MQIILQNYKIAQELCLLISCCFTAKSCTVWPNAAPLCASKARVAIRCIPNRSKLCCQQVCLTVLLLYDKFFWHHQRRARGHWHFCQFQLVSVHFVFFACSVIVVHFQLIYSFLLLINILFSLGLLWALFFVLSFQSLRHHPHVPFQFHPSTFCTLYFNVNDPPIIGWK